MILYRYILSAQNSKFVFLTGTPIINYPNEIGIMFNMLRGYIKTFQLRLQIHSGKVDLNTIKRYLKPIREIDYIQYKSQPPTLIVTRNPHGFINNDRGDNYLGVSLREFGMLSDVEFIGKIKGILNKHNIDIIHQIIQPYTALPEKLDTFNSLFIDDATGNMINTNMFKRRIMGLTSYFRSATEGLMPDFDIDKDLRVIEVPMSDYQLGIYEEAREGERAGSAPAAMLRLSVVPDRDASGVSAHQCSGISCKSPQVPQVFPSSPTPSKSSESAQVPKFPKY